MEPLLIDIKEASRLMGISRQALYKRIKRHPETVPKYRKVGSRYEWVRERFMKEIRSI